MAFRDSWHRALVYFGLAEEYHDEYEEQPSEAALLVVAVLVVTERAAKPRADEGVVEDA